MSKPFIIGIAGPSCSGKTELANCLAERLGGAATVLHLDSYYKDLSALDPQERNRRNFDDPCALDWPLLIEQMSALAGGREIEKPVYLFATHTRARACERIKAGELLIIEGLFALYSGALRQLYDLSVFVDVESEECLRRRIERDTRTRERTRESITLQYEEMVWPMYERHVAPTANFADIAVSGESPVAEMAARVIAGVVESKRFQTGRIRL